MRCILALMLVVVMVTLVAGAEEQQQIVPASEILNKIEKGQLVEYYDVVIEGDLNFNELDLPEKNISWATPPYVAPYIVTIDFFSESYPDINYTRRKVINVPIIIRFSTINGSVNFDEIILDQPVDFRATRFMKDVSLYKTQFSGFINFMASSFYDKFDSRLALFQGDVGFAGANFYESTEFFGTQFFGRADFEDAEFHSGEYSSWIDFSNTQFLDYTIFRNAKFFKGESSWSSFSDAQFIDNVDFSGSEFEGTADFSNSHFGKGAYFSSVLFADNLYCGNVDFNGDSSFHGSVFNASTRFEDDDFEKSVDFTNAKFNGDVDFSGTEFSKYANFDNTNFKNNINLNRTKFTHLELPWKYIKNNHLIYNEAVYLALINNYNNLGWYNDMHQCYYDYRKAVQEHETKGILWLLDFAQQIFYGYGVKPINPILLSVFIISCFGHYLWHKKAVRKLIRKNIIEKRKNEEKFNEVIINEILTETKIIYLDYILFSLSNFTSGFTSFIQPHTEFKLSEEYTWLATAERLVGSLFLAIIITTITRVYLIR
jgi:hypothetical protein